MNPANAHRGLSLILGHLSEIFFSPTALTVSTAITGTLISRLLTGELERFRESVDTIRAARSILDLAYWHVKLLHKRHNPTSNSEVKEIAAVTKTITGILRSHDLPRTPLTLHFAGLSVMTLVELAGIKETKDDAMGGLQDIQVAIEQNHILPPVAREGDSGSWGHIILEQVRKGLHFAQQAHGGTDATIDRGGLQHLADLAVGGSEDGASKVERTDDEPTMEPNETMDGVDWTALTKAGYLNALLEGHTEGR